MANKYTCAVIFTKKGNLNDFMQTDRVLSHWPNYTPSDGYKAHCAKEREIQLFLLTRYDGNKLMCRIKCPVSPLPVKGEFEAPSYSVIHQFLCDNGWTVKQKLYPRMFE